MSTVKTKFLSVTYLMMLVLSLSCKSTQTNPVADVKSTNSSATSSGDESAQTLTSDQAERANVLTTFLFNAEHPGSRPDFSKWTLDKSDEKFSYYSQKIEFVDDDMGPVKQSYTIKLNKLHHFVAISLDASASKAVPSAEVLKTGKTDVRRFAKVFHENRFPRTRFKGEGSVKSVEFVKTLSKTSEFTAVIEWKDDGVATQDSYKANISNADGKLLSIVFKSSSANQEN